jgi:ribonuclease PH
MRLDDRKPDELRPVTITPHFTDFAEGSVLIAAGGTRVLCNVTIEESIPRWMQVQGKSGGWVTGEYAMLPRATPTRTPRETSGVGGRTHEIRRLIGRSLRAAVDLNKLGPRTCIVDCDVLQADGGTRTASVTGGYIALALALSKLIQANVIPPDTLASPVAAVSVGIVEGIPLLDLCYAEDSRADVDANFVMNAAGQFIEVQVTGEANTFSPSTLDDLLKLAYKGIGELLTIQRLTLENQPDGIGSEWLFRRG